MEKENIGKLLSDWRRDLHRYPECGWLTYRTSILVADQLERAGYTVFIGEEIVPVKQAMDPPFKERICEAREICRQELNQRADPPDLWEKWEGRMGALGGVVAICDSKKPGPTVACRFDMDALPLIESTAPDRVPVREGFISVHEGSFHGCGHDGHTAVGVVSALRLMENRDISAGKLILVFQPAEEGVRGAKSYCDNWRFGPIDVFLSGHIGFAGPDTFVAGAEQFLATSEINGEFIGKSAHAGAAPERGKNALLALAEAVVRMQGIPKPKQGTVRLNVGVMQAGEARNTIPAHASFEMETRGSDDLLNQYMHEEAKRILKECAEKYGVQERLIDIGGCNGADSSEQLSQKIYEIAKESGVYKTCIKHQEFGASDDATSFMKMVQEEGGQAVYMLFGCPITGRHHETGFDFDEKVLKKSCEIYVRVIRELMSEKQT